MPVKLSFSLYRCVFQGTPFIDHEHERWYGTRACMCRARRTWRFSPHEEPFVSQVVLAVSGGGDAELGGLTGPSAIINYLQVLQNNNTKKCEPSILPPFTRNQYQYLMQWG